MQIATDNDPAKIAVKLSPAMRDVLSDIDAAGFVVGPRNTLRALARRKLCGAPRYESAEVTALGRDVHATLRAIEGKRGA